MWPWASGHLSYLDRLSDPQDQQVILQPGVCCQLITREALTCTRQVRVPPLGVGSKPMPRVSSSSPRIRALVKDRRHTSTCTPGFPPLALACMQALHRCLKSDLTERCGGSHPGVRSPPSLPSLEGHSPPLPYANTVAR